MVRRSRHMVVVRDHPDGLPVGYASWAEWRADRDPLERLDTAPRDRQCPICWGQRKIWEPGPLGLVPVICEACAGSGYID